jgi:type II secretory pathway pseudopilin PulG
VEHAREERPAWTPGRRHGFTIIELIIVISIIFTIIAVAIPTLRNAKKSAREARAVAALRTTVTVNQQYKTRYGSFALAPANLVASGYLPIDILANDPDGYNFTYAGARHTFTIESFPDTPGVTGDRHYYVDESGVIRYSLTGMADVTSDPIE